MIKFPLNLVWLRKHWSAIVVIFFILFASMLRLYMLYSPPYNSRRLYSDDAIYMDMARGVYEGNFWRVVHPIWMPVYPLVSSISYFFIHDWVLAGVYISLISGILLIIPVYKIMKLLNIKRSYYVGLALLASLPILINSSVLPLTESFFTLLTWTGIYLFLKGLKLRDVKYFVTAGILIGLGALTRSEGIFTFTSLLIVGVVMLPISIVMKGKKDSLGVFRMIIAFIIPLLILYSLFQSVLYLKYKTNLSLSKAVAMFKLTSPFNLNSNKTTTWAQDIDSLDTFNTKSEFFQNGREFFNVYGAIILNDWRIRITQSFTHIFSIVFAKISLVLFAISILSIFSKRYRYGTIVSFVVIFDIVFTMFFASAFQERYLVWMIPGVIIFINLGLEFVLDLVRRRFDLISNLSAIGIFLVLVITPKNSLILNNLFEGNLWWNDPKAYDYTNCRDMLNGKVVMIRHEGYVFDNRSSIVYTPNNLNLEGMLRYAGLYHARYLLAAPGEVPDNIDFLYRDPKNYDNFRLVCNFKQDQRLFVYRID